MTLQPLRSVLVDKRNPYYLAASCYEVGYLFG